MSKFKTIAFTRQLHSLKASIWMQVLTASVWLQVLTASSGYMF